MHKAAVDRGLNVVSLLCTHWHFDHSGGNRTLKRLLPGLEVVSGETDAARTPCVTRRVADLEEWNVGRLTIRAHHVPGHTLGAPTGVRNVDCPARASGSCSRVPSGPRCLALLAPAPAACSPCARDALPSKERWSG